MSLKPKTKDEEIFLFKKFLDQVRRMYDNPELARSIQAAQSGQWDKAFYDKYKPELPVK